MNSAKSWLSTAAVLLALATIAGAFGAHALRGSIAPELLAAYEKGVFYHFVNALGIFLVVILATLNFISAKQSQRLCSLLLVGIILFSGSLYALAMSGVRGLGAITPLGGTAFIIAWLMLAWSLRKNQGRSDEVQI